ncbi:hypothetical protein FQA39_LY15454 [Lamprigera yunnana]|nr:hypothetical protein FQA39_LY15454 [Lamprigera yunnana]
MGKKRSETEINTIKAVALNCTDLEVFDATAKKFAQKEDELCPIGMYTAIVKNYYNLWDIFHIDSNNEEEFDSTDSNTSSSISESYDPFHSDGIASYTDTKEKSFSFSYTLTTKEYEEFCEILTASNRKVKSIKKNQNTEDAFVNMQC